MPSRYVIDVERKLVISTGWNRLTSSEILAHREQISNDPHFRPEFNQLVDGRAVTALDITLDEANAIASGSPFSRASRRAVVATNLVILGFARLMETYSRRSNGREQVRVFHSLPPALKWLGLDKLPQ